MTTLEIVLCFVSVTETIITVVLNRKMKKKLDKERELYEAGVECLFMFEGA